MIFDRLLEQEPFVAAHKAVFFLKEIKWCGELLSAQTVSDDPERTLSE